MAKRKSYQRNSRGKGSVIKLADKSWRGFITVGFDAEGKQIKKWRRGRTKSEVENKLDKISVQSSSFLANAAERVTVEQWLVRFAELRGREVRPRTREDYKYYLSKILPELGHIQLAKLTPLHVRTFYSKLTDAGLSPSVRQHVHYFLKGAVREALRMEFVGSNVLELIDTPRGGKVIEATAWEPDEVRAFIAVAKDDRLYGAFYLMLTQGLRIGEVLSLHWTDLTGNKLHVSRTVNFIDNVPMFGPTKTQRGNRTLYLSPDVLEVLSKRRVEQWQERDITTGYQVNDLIFSSTVGTVTSPNNVRRAYRKLIQKAGVRRIRIHDHRHTYITLARDAGVDAEVVAQRAGQDVRVTLQIYSKVTEERKRRAALSLNELIQ